mmetsp:Transcript_71018/g.230569  ORF Transcript_71018/g.230569 Transcript_71018/m.230569 type:complete len:377 (-) Transcript_71018:5131-6261(-)
MTENSMPPPLHLRAVHSERCIYTSPSQLIRTLWPPSSRSSNGASRRCLRRRTTENRCRPRRQHPRQRPGPRRRRHVHAVRRGKGRRGGTCGHRRLRGRGRWHRLGLRGHSKQDLCVVRVRIDVEHPLLPLHGSRVAVDQQLVRTAAGADVVVEVVQEDQRQQGERDDHGYQHISGNAVRADPVVEGQSQDRQAMGRQKNALGQEQAHVREAPLQNQACEERLVPAHPAEEPQRQAGFRNLQDHHDDGRDGEGHAVGPDATPCRPQLGAASLGRQGDSLVVVAGHVGGRLLAAGTAGTGLFQICASLLGCHCRVRAACGGGFLRCLLRPLPCPALRSVQAGLGDSAATGEVFDEHDQGAVEQGPEEWRKQDGGIQII